MPVDIYVGGMEHAIMHLLYARFIHKFICDVKGIDDKNLREPFTELIVQGLVKGKTFKNKEGKYLNKEEPGCLVTFEKMSKSKGNGVAPEDLIQIYGADSLRSALLFAAPPESDLNFEISILASMSQFLKRIQKLVPNVSQPLRDFNFKNPSSMINTQEDKKIAKDCLSLLIDFEQKIEQRLFHVAFARLMEFANQLQKSQDSI